MIFKMNKKLEKILADSYIPKQVEVAGLTLYVKQSLTYVERVQLATMITQSAIINGEYNAKTEEIGRVVYLTQFYGDIVVEQGEFGLTELYDIYVKAGIYDAIVNSVPKSEIERTISFIDNVIDEEREKINNKNSLSGMLNELVYVGKNLLVTMQTLQENGKVEEVISGLSKELEKLDPEKLEYVNAFMEKVSEGEGK